MTNGKPRVTVLMPVYNGEKYLREAIDSILNKKSGAIMRMNNPTASYRVSNLIRTILVA